MKEQSSLMQFWRIFRMTCFLLCMLAPLAHAQNFWEKAPVLNKVPFSTELGDKGALAKARYIYKSYWEPKGVTFDPSAPESAAYIPLTGRGSERKFIIYQRATERGGVCARLGCEISVFENYADDKWQLILSVFSHEIWVSNIKTNKYFDLYTQASGNDGETRKIRWIWNGGGYVQDKEEK